MNNLRTTPTTQPGEVSVPVEYATPQPDRSVRLVEGGEVVALFANPELMEQTRQFLARRRQEVRR